MGTKRMPQQKTHDLYRKIKLDARDGINGFIADFILDDPEALRYIASHRSRIIEHVTDSLLRHYTIRVRRPK